MQKNYRQEAYKKFVKGYTTWTGFEGTKYVMRYKLRDNPALGKYYNWITFDEFRPSSIRATGDGFVTKKESTPVDCPDTVLIQYKEAKPSNEALAAEIKAAVAEILKDLSIPEDSVVAVSPDSAMIKTTEDKAAKAKAMIEVHITSAQGATITII